MRALMIGQEQLDRVAEVKAHAEANIIPIVRVWRIAHGLEAPYFTPDFLAEIPFGFRAVYAVEEQERGLFRHLSVSVDGEQNWPHPASVELLLKAFGMPPLEQNFTLWTEPNRGKERRNIVNVMAPFQKV